MEEPEFQASVNKDGEQVPKHVGAHGNRTLDTCGGKHWMATAPGRWGEEVNSMPHRL